MWKRLVMAIAVLVCIVMFAPAIEAKEQKFEIGLQYGRYFDDHGGTNAENDAIGGLVKWATFEHLQFYGDFLRSTDQSTFYQISGGALFKINSVLLGGGYEYANGDAGNERFIKFILGWELDIGEHVIWSLYPAYHRSITDFTGIEADDFYTLTTAISFH